MSEVERLARRIADEIVPYECNRNEDLRALLLEFAEALKQEVQETPMGCTGSLA
jgi:hypothetical protein